MTFDFFDCTMNVGYVGGTWLLVISGYAAPKAYY